MFAVLWPSNFRCLFSFPFVSKGHEPELIEFERESPRRADFRRPRFQPTSIFVGIANQKVSN